MQKTVSDCTELDEKLNELYQETDVVTELTRKCVEENSQAAMNQDEYQKRYNGFVERYEVLRAKITDLEAQKKERQTKGIYIGGFMFEISEFGMAITEFDEQLWMMVIDKRG